MLEAFPNMKIRNTKSTVEIREFLVNLKKDAASLFVFFFRKVNILPISIILWAYMALLYHFYIKKIYVQILLKKLCIFFLQLTLLKLLRV